MLPGLGDGLKTVKGMALPIAMMYKRLAKKFQVYVFSRKNKLEEDCSTRDMAKDLAKALNDLNLKKVFIVGISQGGMIAQWLTIDYPELVAKLILAVTMSKPNDIVCTRVSNWIVMAKQGDYKGLMIDTAEKSYSEKKLKKYRKLYPLLTKIGKPKDFTRFIIQAKSCLTHDSFNELNKIKCPTFAIGAEKDNVVGIEATQEIVNNMSNCILYIYKELGHAAYEEAKDFNDKVIEFLDK